MKLWMNLCNKEINNILLSLPLLLHCQWYEEMLQSKINWTDIDNVYGKGVGPFTHPKHHFEIINFGDGHLHYWETLEVCLYRFVWGCAHAFICWCSACVSMKTRKVTQVKIGTLPKFAFTLQKWVKILQALTKKHSRGGVFLHFVCVHR